MQSLKRPVPSTFGPSVTGRSTPMAATRNQATPGAMRGVKTAESGTASRRSGSAMISTATLIKNCVSLLGRERRRGSGGNTMMRRLLVGIGELDDGRLLIRRREECDSDRQAVVGESSRNGDR